MVFLYVFVVTVLRIVLAVVVIVLSLLLLRWLMLVDDVSILLLLSQDAVGVCAMTIVLPWFGQPLKESYMYLLKLPNLPTMFLYMHPFSSFFVTLSNLAFCLNPYDAQFQFCGNSWLSLLTHKFQMMQATKCQMCGNYIL